MSPPDGAEIGEGDDGSAGTVSWRQLWTETSALLGDAVHARWVCESASGMSGIDWIQGLDEPAGERGVARLDAMVARRRAGEPIQYVLGSWPFRHVELAIDRRVLIPRPETEEVAGAAISLAAGVPAPRVVVDLGTGSGAIALAAADELSIDGTSVWATDVSVDALDVARANLAGLGRKGRNVSLADGSWFAALPDSLRGTIDVLVSNPPYVAAGSALLDDSVREWEPAAALFAGPEGLDAYEVIVGEAPGWLAPGGWIVLEIGADQAVAVGRMLAVAGFGEIEIRRDAAGLDRMAIGRRPFDD